MKVFFDETKNCVFIQRGTYPQKLSFSLDLNDEEAKDVITFLSQSQSLLSKKSEFSIEFDGQYWRKIKDIDFHSRDLVLFPGSFSPWHQGHMTCVKNCPSRPIVVIPDNNPWKKGPRSGRWKQLKILAENLYEQKNFNEVYLYVGFLLNEVANPTVEWLPTIRNDNKWLLIGDDSFMSLDKWKNAPKLIQGLKGIYICPRLVSEDELKKQAHVIKNISQSISLEFLPHHPYEDVSSTKIRD